MAEIAPSPSSANTTSAKKVAVAAQRNRVHTLAPDVKADLERHELAGALREGVRAMRRHARTWKYMRPNPGELEIVELGGKGEEDHGAHYEGLGQATSESGQFTVYDLRVERACMPNPWAETIRDTARLPFRSRIVMEGWDDELQGKEVRDKDGEFVSAVAGWVANLDGEGRSIDEWAAEAFEDSQFDGIVYAFVDNDPRSFASPEDRRKAGGRPYVAKLRRCDIRRIVIERGENGVPRIKQVAFRQDVAEQETDDPDDWKDESQEAYKVVTAGRWLYDAEGKKAGRVPVAVRVYLIDQNGEPVEDPTRAATIEPEDPLEVLLDVPLVPLYGKRTGPYRGESPYLDTAETQVAIWNQMSELINKARETSLAYLHESGVGLGDDAKPLNPDTRNLRYRSSTDPGARLTFAEQSGDSLEGLRRLVEWLVEQVRDAHHQLRSESPTGPVTAREITLEGVHASSALEMMVIFHEAGWKAICDLMALLGGLPKRGVVSIPHDFGLPNTAMERLKDLFALGRMTAKNYWGEALRAGDVDEAKFDLEAELALEREESKLAERAAARELTSTFDDEDGEDSEGGAGDAGGEGGGQSGGAGDTPADGERGGSPAAGAQSREGGRERGRGRPPRRRRGAAGSSSGASA
jgi:hypothetical protein